jgi:hypothetical protein
LASRDSFPDFLSVSTKNRWPATTRLASAAREAAYTKSRLLLGMRLGALSVACDVMIRYTQSLATALRVSELCGKVRGHPN